MSIEEQFQQFLKVSFRTMKHLDETQVRVMRHCYFGGWDHSLQFVLDEIPVCPIGPLASHFRSISAYNDGLRKLKSLRKPRA